MLFHCSYGSLTHEHQQSMDFGHLIFAVIGFSSSFILFVPNVKSRQRQQVATEKLRIINEALEQAEERVVRFQERHDRILSQMCSLYMTHKELEEAMAAARAAMNEALDFSANLRRMQLKIIGSFPSDQPACNHNTDTYRPRNN